MNYAEDPRATREAVKIRDQNKCMNCGIEGNSTKMDVHHIVPRNQGGSNQMSNLILLCRKCHDAAHGECMAPTVDFETSGEMENDEFEQFRKLFQNFQPAIFDQGSKIWRIPKSDMNILLSRVETENGSDPPSGGSGPEDDLEKQA